jgi:hypothetical protein
MSFSHAAEYTGESMMVRIRAWGTKSWAAADRQNSYWYIDGHKNESRLVIIVCCVGFFETSE